MVSKGFSQVITKSAVYIGVWFSSRADLYWDPLNSPSSLPVLAKATNPHSTMLTYNSHLWKLVDVMWLNEEKVKGYEYIFKVL